MNPSQRILVSAPTAALLSAGVSALSPGAFWPGWLAAFVILVPCVYLLITAWQGGGAKKTLAARKTQTGGKTLAAMMTAAFILRAVIGIAVTKALPVYGYDTEVQYHGYLFRDSHERDIAAWNLAQSDGSLWSSFSNEIKADQYGGLLSLSAAVYRYLSPDAHRPFLILILGAFFTALGVPFLVKGISLRWNRQLANLAAWIVVLYPDGVLFGSSQMREPFLLGLSMIAFWAVLSKEKSRIRLLSFSASLAGMLLISSRLAVAIGAFLAAWFLLEEILPKYRGPRWSVGVGLALAFILISMLSYGWLIESASLDIKLTEMGSGWVQKIVDEAGPAFRVPIIVAYGLAQPVLPAALAEPTIPLWRMIAVPRAAGWYLAAPVLLYGMFSALKARPASDRRILIWTAAFLLIWLVLSSFRAGGDAWDNPRYRAAFLPWIGLLSGWAVLWAIEQRDAWLTRWLVVEVIFLGFFTSWYISRYYQWWGRLSFWQLLVWIVGLGTLALSSGWWGKWLAGLVKKQ